MTSEEQQSPRPDCYGVLEKVFPRSKEGLREVQEQCWNCGERVECLRQAVSGQGPQGMSSDSAPRDGAILGGVGGFLNRWAKLKSESKKDGR
ncbi:MAG: hypothetical protein V1806_01080 [Pseudomonadota bacterium]